MGTVINSNIPKFVSVTDILGNTMLIRQDLIISVSKALKVSKSAESEIRFLDGTVEYVQESVECLQKILTK